MVFHPLSSLFTTAPFEWQEADLKYFVQEFLRQRLKSEAIYCDSVADGVATIRVGTPALQQAAHILEYDLKQRLVEEAGYTLQRVVVRTVPS